MDEQWKPVVGYEGIYEVSSHGLIRSLDRPDTWGRPTRGRVMKPYQTTSGHLRVTLSKSSSTTRFFVHRLVLTAFVGPRPHGMEGCHNDGNPTNNSVSNLRWDTKRANARDRRSHGNDAHARKTHCPHGHRYDSGNTYLSQQGWRHCRTCVLASQKKMRDLKRARKAA